MAVEFKFIDNKNNALLAFKAMQKLEFKENRNGWVDFGKDNLYPQELIRLYDEHPEHRAIINRKARYIWGKGIKAKNPQDEIKVNAFIEGFNKEQDLNQAGKKLTPNTEIFNGCYVQVITDLMGRPIYFYFLKNANCRISECKTKLYYSKKWKRNTREQDIKVLDKFEENGKAGTYFIEWKYEVPTSDSLADTYPIENYRSAVKEINTDIDITTFMENYVVNGFSVGTIISFFNGTPSDPVISSIDRAFKGTYTGEKGETVLITHGDNDSKKPEITTVGIEELAEKFKFTAHRAQQKIFAAHEIPSEFFNKKFDDSFFSSSTDLVTLQEMHIKGYIEPRQEALLEFISYLSYLKTGEYLDLMIEPLGLVGIDIQDNVNFSEDEKREALGYGSKNTTAKPQAQAVNDAINALSPLVANKVLESMSEDEIRALASLPPKNAEIGIDGKPIVDVNGMPVAAKDNSGSGANEHIKSMTRKQLNNMHGIKKDYDSGKATLEQSLLALKGFGLNEDDANIWLGVNPTPTTFSAIFNSVKKWLGFENQTEKILAALELSAEDDNDDEVILTQMAHIHNSKDALKYERQIMKFADTLTITVEQLDGAILNALKGNPTMSIEDLASSLKYDVSKVEESIARLYKGGYILDDITGFKPTEKGLKKDTEPVKQYEIYTVYKYALRDDAPSLVKGGSSRPFCKKLMALSASGKHWKFETINNMENDLGTNVWDYRGGYYTNKVSGEIEPDCRHVWQAITKRRLVKK